MANDFYITSAQMDEITAAFNDFVIGAAPDLSEMYALIYAAIQGESALPDANGNPVMIAPNVSAWFGAAEQANGGTGGASTLIRTYTQAQIEIRSGEAMADPEGQIQAASNAIAEEVYRDILNTRVTRDGETYYRIPDAVQIGGTDAAEAVRAIPDLELSMWSGNPLFIGLGTEEFWVENVLTDPTNTYDLFVAMQALRIAGFASLSEIADLFEQFIGGGVLGSISAASNAAIETDRFLDTAYGAQLNDYFGIFANLVFMDLAIGSSGNDLGFAPYYSVLDRDNDIVHTGDGHDFINGTRGLDLVDGGAGDDTLSFNLIGEEYGSVLPLQVRIYSHPSEIPFAAYIDTSGDPSVDSFILAYDIEYLELGYGDHVVSIESWSNLQSVDAGQDEDQFGDTLDISSLETGVVVDLSQGTVSNFFGSLSVTHFENVRGTDLDDELTGDDSTFGNVLIGGGGIDTINGMGGDDIILGGDGADIIDGGDGDDFISGGIGRDVIDGGTGWDVLTYADLGIGAAEEAGIIVDLHNPENSTDIISNIEVFVGTEYADHFISSAAGGEWFAGGGSSDNFTITRFGGENGPTVVWGGEGADTITIASTAFGVPQEDANISNGGVDPIGILLVDAPDVTEENFHLLDFASLGFGPDFDWSIIDLVVVNHEDQDVIQFENIIGEASIGAFEEVIQEIRIVNWSVQYRDGDNFPGVDVLETFTVGQVRAGDTVFDVASGESNWAAGNFDVAIDGFSGEIFGSAAYVIHNYYDSDGNTVHSPWFHEGILTRETEFFGFPDGEPSSLGGWGDLGGLGDPDPATYVDHLSAYPTVTDINSFHGWFIIGGEANYNGVTSSGANGAYTISVGESDLYERLEGIGVAINEGAGGGNGEPGGGTGSSEGTSTASMVDVEDAFSWTSYVGPSNHAGERVSGPLEYDDGWAQETTYTDGVRSANVITDDADQFVWAILDQTFDADGVAAAETNTHDDERVFETLYADGVRSTLTMTDVVDAYSWASYIDADVEAIDRVSRLFTNDDGFEFFI